VVDQILSGIRGARTRGLKGGEWLEEFLRASPPCQRKQKVKRYFRQNFKDTWGNRKEHLWRIDGKQGARQHREEKATRWRALELGGDKPRRV